MLIPSSVTLAGSATDVWVFEIAQDFTVNNARERHLQRRRGCRPTSSGQVSGQVSLGTTAQFVGVVLGQTSITLGTGASVHGRLFAQTAVSIDSGTVTAP